MTNRNDTNSLVPDLLDEARRAEERLEITRDAHLHIYRQGEVTAWLLVRKIVQRHLAAR